MIKLGAMQTEPAERRRQPGRGRRTEGGQLRAETRGAPAEETARLSEVIATTSHRGRRARPERESDEEEVARERGRGRDRSRGDGARRAASEGGGASEESARLRWRINELEKEKLELTSRHNQQLCRLQAELARLRSSMERGEAKRAELDYQLTVSQRDADRAAELSRDKRTLTERVTALQQTVQEVQRALDITRQVREEDQHALHQEVEERDRLIHGVSAENKRLHQLLQDQEEAQEEALEAAESKTAEVQKEREREAEVNRRQAEQLKCLTEREERSRGETEVWEQRVKSLESNMEAERAAHLQCKFNTEITQLRVRELEAALAVERSGQQEAQRSLDLLSAQLREAENAYSAERERRSDTERALERLQREYAQCKSDLVAALEAERKTTSDLTEQLEEERRRHASTHSLLEQAAKRCSDAEEAFVGFMEEVREALQHHGASGRGPPAKDDGSLSPSAKVLLLLKMTLGSIQTRLEETEKQVQDLLSASESLHEENQTLTELTSNQSSQIKESQQASLRLQDELSRLRQESCDWSTQRGALQLELEKEREQRRREKEDGEREREERRKEREERSAQVKKITDRHETESKTHLTFLYTVYQRLLAGCVVLHQPLGNFTWKELCDVISEQVDQLTSDLQKANSKIVYLQSVCEKKSVCIRELQRSQECVLLRLEESMRMREESWSSQHTHAVTQLQSQLQLCRSQRDSLHDRISAMTSDLARLQGLLSQSRGESASLLAASALLTGTTAHAHRRLRALCQQKTLLSRRLADREELEEEVRRLAGALGGGGGAEEAELKGRRAAAWRWKRNVWLVLAVRRWRVACEKSTVLFRLERGGGGPDVGVCVCRESVQKGPEAPSADDGDDEDEGDEGHGGACARWLRSKRLAASILSSMSDLQGALAHTGSSPSDVMSAARSALSCLLNDLLNQSDVASPGRVDMGVPTQSRPPPQSDMKALVFSLQQHFLLFSQRLHSAEVERRSLRLEVANLKRAERREKGEGCRTVPQQRFNSVCAELRQALSREQEAQTLIQEQSAQLNTLQLQADAHAAERARTQHTLSQTEQSMSQARQQASQKERSLRILGKHLSEVQRDRKELEERLRQAEEELRDAAGRQDRLINYMKAAEMSCTQVRDCLFQSDHSLPAQPRPPSPLRKHLEPVAAESIMGAPDMAACQSLLSTFSQLYQTYSCRIDWLQQEVSAHRSHVTALRSELQDACVCDGQACVPAAEFPPACADVEAPPLWDLLNGLSTAPSQTHTKSNPAPSLTKPTTSSPLCKPTKTKAKKAVRIKGQVKSGGRG